MSSHDTHAVVLAGGGAYGAYEVGVMEALFSGRWRRGLEHPVAAEIFSGTSVGAFSAAVMASYPEADCLAVVRYLKELWLERIASRDGRRENGVFRFRGDIAAAGNSLATRLRAVVDDVSFEAQDLLWRGLSIGLSGDPISRRYLRLFDASSVICAEPLERLVEDTIDPQRLLDPSARTLTVSTTDWDRGMACVFSNRPPPREGSSYLRQRIDASNARLAVLASAAIPGFFPAVQIGDDQYVDGGLLMNTPLDPAASSGANVLHVVRLEGDLESIPRFRAPSGWETLERILVAVPSNLLDRSLHRSRKINDMVEAARSIRRYLDAHPKASREVDAALAGHHEKIERFLDEFSEMIELTIHCYQPRRSLAGAIGLLDFRREHIIELIDLGFRDAVEHDCEAQGCILAGHSSSAASQPLSDLF